MEKGFYRDRFVWGLGVGVVYIGVMQALGAVMQSSGGSYTRLVSLLVIIAVYSGLGWWGTKHARNAKEGLNLGASLGLGCAVAAVLVLFLLLVLRAHGNLAGGRSLALLGLAFISEAKFAAFPALIGRWHGTRNDKAIAPPLS